MHCIQRSPAVSTTPRKTTETALGILGSMALLYWLAMQFAHEQVEQVWTRMRAINDLQCWSLSSSDDGLSTYTRTGCGRSAVYSCAPAQVITPVYPLIYGISCTRSR